MLHDRLRSPGPWHRWPATSASPGPGWPDTLRAAVGELLMGYLTGWRMALAADLLTGGDAPVARVAWEVDTPFVHLQPAFKRHHGVSPLGFRRGERDVLRSGFHDERTR